MRQIRVGILYPTDPFGGLPGGIDSFIRDEIAHAPEHIRYSVAGITTDPVARPVLQWQQARVGEREIDFLPLCVLRNRARQPRIPICLRYCVSLLRNRHRLAADIFEFHRMEPMLMMNSTTPRVAVAHQHPLEMFNPTVDCRWRHAPEWYVRLEDRVVPSVDSLFSIRRDGAKYYRKKYPALKNRVTEITTWVDPHRFFPMTGTAREDQRCQVLEHVQMPRDSILLITVGRIAAGKNPRLLCDAIAHTHAQNQRVRLIWVGDGSMRRTIQSHLRKLGLAQCVHFSGVLESHEISHLLQVADVFVFSSNYDAMPMAVMEALGSGLPVATTRVGDIQRMVYDGINGRIAKTSTPMDLATAILDCIQHTERYSGDPCLKSVAQFRPQQVLSTLYENYAACL